MCCFDWNTVKTIVEIITGICGVIISILGVSLFFTFRQKQNDTAFNFLSRLNLRIKRIKLYFENEDLSNYVLDELIIPKYQDTNINFINKKKAVIESLSKEINDTLEYIKKEENQIPVTIGWTKEFDSLINLIMELDTNINCKIYKWGELYLRNEEKESYLSNSIAIMNSILDDINICQKYLEYKTARKKQSMKRFVEKREK